VGLASFIALLNSEPNRTAPTVQEAVGGAPSLSSRTYLTHLAEVRAYGCATSAVRTPQQTDIARFWELAINIQYVQVLRAVLAETRAARWPGRRSSWPHSTSQRPTPRS
jgi:hypothetical protein